MMPKDDWVDIEGYFPYKINRNGDIINSITNKLKHKSFKNRCHRCHVSQKRHTEQHIFQMKISCLLI